MRTIGILFNLIGVFLIPVGIVYGIMTKLDDWAGFPAILATAAMCFFLGTFLMFTDKKHPDQPNDNLDGEIADAAGEYGFYSPWSWWPLVIGAICAVLVTAMAIGQYWLALIAGIVAILGCVGWVYEYSRGDHAH